MLICRKICFAAIYAVLAQNLFCCDLRTFVWRKICLEIVLVEKKGQISGMVEYLIEVLMQSSCALRGSWFGCVQLRVAWNWFTELYCEGETGLSLHTALPLFQIFPLYHIGLLFTPLHCSAI